MQSACWFLCRLPEKPYGNFSRLSLKFHTTNILSIIISTGGTVQSLAFHVYVQGTTHGVEMASQFASRLHEVDIIIPSFCPTLSSIVVVIHVDVPEPYPLTIETVVYDVTRALSRAYREVPFAMYVDDTKSMRRISTTQVGYCIRAVQDMKRILNSGLFGMALR